MTSKKVMNASLVKEAEEMRAAEIAQSKGMDKAQAKEKQRLKDEEFELAKFRGEKKTPDGRIIQENQNVEIRPLDPRFNPAFGNPFFRINSIEKKEEEVMSAFSEKELEFLDSLDEDFEEDDEESGFTDVVDQFIVSEDRPRAVCGLSREDAMSRCGQTCNPDIPTCLAQSSSLDTNMFQIDGAWFIQGHCFEDISCGEDDLEAALEGGPCSAKKVNNPCPNPCDCHKSSKTREKCHSRCSSLKSRDVLQCMKLREAGMKKREKKVLAEILKQEEEPCEYNIHFVHPLLSFTELSGIDLPGLFETF